LVSLQCNGDIESTWTLNDRGFLVEIPPYGEMAHGHLPATNLDVDFILVPLIQLGQNWFYRAQMIVVEPRLGSYHAKVVKFMSKGGPYRTADDNNPSCLKINEPWGGFINSALYLKLQEGILRLYISRIF